MSNPNNLALYGKSAPSFVVKVNQSTTQSTWYELGGDSFAFTQNGTINQTAWTKMENGTVDITFCGENSAGVKVSIKRTVRKDNISPSISLLSDIDNETFGEDAPGFKLNVSDPNLKEMWCTINGHNKTYINRTGTINQTVWGLLEDGEVELSFHAIDEVGNTAQLKVIVHKDTAEDKDGSQGGEDTDGGTSPLSDFLTSPMGIATVIGGSLSAIGAIIFLRKRMTSTSKAKEARKIEKILKEGEQAPKGDHA